MSDRPEWMNCKTRAPWVTNSLRARIADMRGAERRCRHAFNKAFMGEPATYLADVYGEVAALLESKLRLLEARKNDG